jgi:hypothetical protein
VSGATQFGPYSKQVSFRLRMTHSFGTAEEAAHDVPPLWTTSCAA